MSGSDSDFSPRSEDDTSNYSPESFFPGDNEIFDDTTAWGSPEFNFWSYFFKIVSNANDDYHTPFSTRVHESSDGKINWDFWLKNSINSDPAEEYPRAIQKLIAHVSDGEFVFGRDYAKKLGSLLEEVKVHRRSHLEMNPPAYYSSHRNILELWLQFQSVLAKVKTGPSLSDWVVMVVIAGLGVYIYYLYASFTNAYT